MARATRYHLPTAECWERSFPLDGLAEGQVLQQVIAEDATIGRLRGEGLFFTSKAVHFFRLTSGVQTWVVDNHREDMAVVGVKPPLQGTFASVVIDHAGVHSVATIFDEYTLNYAFAKTRSVARLFAIGVSLVSRSRAKRFLHGLDRFRELVLGFRGGVEGVGQRFANEVFRVWARAHSTISLHPVNMNETTAFMAKRALREES